MNCVNIIGTISPTVGGKREGCGRLSTKLYPTMRVESVMTDILVVDCFGKIELLRKEGKLKKTPQSKKGWF